MRRSLSIAPSPKREPKTVEGSGTGTPILACWTVCLAAKSLWLCSTFPPRKKSDSPAISGTLTEIAEVRPVDVAIAQANLEKAQAYVQQAQANLNLAYVKAPRSGQILKIHTYGGERVEEN